MARLCFGLGLFSLLALGCASAASETEGSAGPPAAAIAPESAFYTESQAAAGERVFSRICAVCHGTNEFRGRMFELTWMTQPIGSLYQHISTAMPQDDPGSLTPEEYAAVIAYFLQMNGIPPGDRALPANSEVLDALHWE